MSTTSQPRRSRHGQARVTMRDIAEIAGVSRTTVSHALSGRGRVEASTRQRIRDIARELGFVPSATALALKTGRTGILAIVNATTGGSLEYFMLAANAASHEALEAGYTLALVPTQRDTAWVEQLAMDGLIVLDPLDDDPLLEVLQARGIPVVTIGHDPSAPRPGEPRIRTDRTIGVDVVYDHLRDRGARRPALIIDEQNRQWIRETRAAYTDWMHRHGLEPVILDVDATSPEPAGYEAVQHLLTHTDVDGAYVPFDPLMSGVLAALEDRAVRVPQDFRLVAQEGVRARHGRPRLTALDDRPADVARLAMRALIAQLTDPTQPPPSHLVQPRLLVRETT